MCQVCEAAVHVNPSSPGPMRDGRSWNTAYTSINDALTQTRSGDIWVKSGMYRERITLTGYRNIYGGFAGTETQLEQRPVNGLPTVISAQFAGRVVDIGVGARSILDRLVLINGVADRGAAIRCQTNSVVKIRNCRIQNCEAKQMGGGVYFGTYTSGDLDDCIITNNRAPLGGGVVVEYHSYPVLRRAIIAWNNASISGGGLYCPFHSGARLENCTLAFNRAATSGGAVYAYQGGPVTLVSSILAYNSSPAAGGVFGGGTSSATTLTGCCFWSNTGGDWGGTIRTPPPYANNLFVDPMFVNAPYGDFRLMPGSPCNGIGACP